jgi:hypothetical protein
MLGVWVTAAQSVAYGGSQTLGVRCHSNGECASGFCADGVCCASACGDACDRCDLRDTKGTCTPASPGATGDPSCAPYLCDGQHTSCPGICFSQYGCAPGTFCSSRHCEPKKGTGEPCGHDVECVGGFCADGFCCATACDGACETCAASEGSSADGTCTTRAAGTSIEGCDGYRCDGHSSQCPEACASDSQCFEGRYCERGKCAPTRDLGQSCDASHQCSSGFCADGSCCDSACGQQCEACDVKGHRGQCTPVSGPPEGSRAACAGDGSSCQGQCDGANAASCGYATSTLECSPAHCDHNAAYATGRCDGAGQCAASRTACSPYVCEGATCTTTCSSDSGCASGFDCESGVCVALRVNGSACTEARTCASGACADGVCCTSACDGTCDRCDLPGHVGQCLAVPLGSKPHPASCGAYRCNGSLPACPESCASDAVCAEGFDCEEGACALRRENGVACSRNEQCLSGACTDGVCCDSSCPGTCSSCALPEHVGVCSAVTGAPAPARGSCHGAGLCAGTCDGSGPDCHYPNDDTPCGAGSCDNAVAVAPRSCDGEGQCVSGPSHECPTGCEGAQCASEMLRSDNSGCATGPVGALSLGCAVLALRRPSRRASRKVG